jgi:penicillin amidase
MHSLLKGLTYEDIAMSLISYLLKTFRISFLFAALTGVMSGVAGIGLMGLISLSLGSGSLPLFEKYGFGYFFFGLCFLQFVLRVITNLLLNHLGQATVFKLRMDLTKQILSLPLRRLQEMGVPRLFALLTDDVASIATSCEFLPLFIINFAVVVSCLAYLGWLSLDVLWLIGGIIFIGVMSFRIAQSRALRNLHAAREQNDVIFFHMRGLTEGIKELKIRRKGQASFVSNSLRPAAAAYRHHYMNGMALYVLASNWGNGLFYVAVGLILFILPEWSILPNEVLTGCVLAIIYMMAPLSVIMSNLPVLGRASIALNKIRAFAKESTIHKEGEIIFDPSSSLHSSGLELKGVMHRYRRENDDRSFTLGPLNLTLQSGELVFVVGGNGSGKTTFAMVLMGLYVPEHGNILLSGQRIGCDNREAYRQNFAVVFSDFYLFESLLGFENRELDDKAREYLRRLQLDHKVKIENGRFSTLELSQGQRKRLALLVAYLEDRPFYIFDEWAADQDPVFKRIFYMEILPALKARGKTVVVITHDDGYFHVADRCLRLEDGKITEAFTFKTHSAGEEESSMLEKKWRHWNIDPIEQEFPVGGKEIVCETEVEKVVLPADDSVLGSLDSDTGGVDSPNSLSGNASKFRLIGRVSIGIFVTIGIVAVGAFLVLRASLPEKDMVYEMTGFRSSVDVKFDQHGVPRIIAASREDAYRALGFVAARDRLFQMDLLRRRSAGRLAEILGAPLLESDRWHRTMGFGQVAAAIAARLPDDQKVILDAYVGGINQAIEKTRVLPFEFLVLGYRPEPWRVEDSFLVVLGMFENLTWRVGEKERMVTVMEAALAPEVLAFLTPDSDRYANSVVKNSSARRPPQPLPQNALAKLLKETSEYQAGLVGEPDIVAGSNGWLVNAHKTSDGRAILANDMHLELRVPNIWYRAEMQVDGNLLSGITLPGVPLFISGTNSHVAWGFTSVAGDFLDFVLVDVDRADPEIHLTPSGTARFGVRSETIHVKGMPDTSFDVRTTRWGPVLPDSLLGKPLAVHWTALDPAATNLDLLRLGEALDVFEALSILQQAGGPPLNGLVADNQGNIGWTYVGRIPIREKMDGLASRSWASGTMGWKGYVPSHDKPRVVNPPEGYLVNANQRMVGQEYPYVIGHDFDSGYRAYRIAERLAEMDGITEQDLLKLQLDTRTDFYRYYQALALAVIDANLGDEAEEELSTLRRYIQAWDGRAETGSLGLPVLVEFRRILADAVFSPLLARCRELDPHFQYNWHNMDEPLRTLLETLVPELQPEKAIYPNWNAFLLGKLKNAADTVVAVCGSRFLDDVSWGCVNKTRIEHPFSATNPLLGALLNMPVETIPGCTHCVRAASGRGGASERLVVAPGYEVEGIFQMPTGQSGNPLSAYYSDQHKNWVNGTASVLLGGKLKYLLKFRPAQSK